MLNDNEAPAWPGSQAHIQNEMNDGMEVLIENNPVIRKVWSEWVVKDRELSGMTKEERMDYCKRYQWVYPKETNRMVDLESLYSSVHYRRNREEFYRWFYVVCGYMLSRVHLGDNSYYWYKSRFKKEFRREKCTSVDFPKQVLLVLAMLGYITELGGWYIFNQGSDKNRGYHFIIDKEKLMTWDSLDKEWEMSHTESISFKEKGYDPDRTSWTLHPDWLSERQYESIYSAKVLEEGIKVSSEWLFSFDKYKYYYNLSDEEQEDLMKNWLSYQKLRDMSIGRMGGCLDDSDKPDGKGYAGRFYSPMTNLEGEHRHKYLRLDGELVTEVDISSAQPTFLGIMMYQMTGVKSEWLRQCISGDNDFYKWIKEKTDSKEDRKTIKKWMMQYMYSCYQPNKGKDYDKPHKPTYEFIETEDPFLCFQQRLDRFLKKNEPAIYKIIDWFKRHPEYREDKPLYRPYIDESGVKRKKKIGEGKWCSMLSYYLVKMEVEYIKRCIHSLPEDMKFWTIHDCICVKESDSMKVKEIMEQVSREMYGRDITLRLKRENISEDYS